MVISTLSNVQIKKSKTEPKVIVNLALLQLITAVVTAIFVYFLFDAREALSALFGGLVAAFASFFLAGRLFMTKSDIRPGEMLARFYLSVALKALFTLSMMVIFIVVMKVSILSFIFTYLLVALIVNWLFLFISAR